jgi:hypothetical protein
LLGPGSTLVGNEQRHSASNTALYRYIQSTVDMIIPETKHKLMHMVKKKYTKCY